MRFVLFIALTLSVSAANAERFLPAAEEAKLRELVPPLADARLAARIEDESQTYFYTSKRFWQREYGYTYPYRYTYTDYSKRGRGRRTTTTQIRRVGGTAFQHLAKEITDTQWQNAGGVAAEPDVREVKFISLPKVDGNIVPMVFQGTEVTYPNGTLFGGILCRAKGDVIEPFEFRLREKVKGGWKSTICRPENDRFAATKLPTQSCAQCHTDAGTSVVSSFGWSGTIGSDGNFSFGEWAANIREPGDFSEARMNAQMIGDGLLEPYDADKHLAKVYGL
ncbi:MAG TPA: hypothetical protein VMM76_07510 [Pirellulaceae bacterium]|nr:hypothetical protein [Pirellulaceae bacterium]